MSNLLSFVFKTFEPVESLGLLESVLSFLWFNNSVL